jgi:flagellar biosynthesis protein
MNDRSERRAAVALGYNPAKDSAPKVLAKGRGLRAEKILEIAKAHRIPLREDPGLLELLAKVDVDQEIPPILYRAVAEILAFVYQMAGAKR